jgi:hypothetical protein
LKRASRARIAVEARRGRLEKTLGALEAVFGPVARCEQGCQIGSGLFWVVAAGCAGHAAPRLDAIARRFGCSIGGARGVPAGCTGLAVRRVGGFRGRGSGRTNVTDLSRAGVCRNITSRTRVAVFDRGMVVGMPRCREEAPYGAHGANKDVLRSVAKLHRAGDGVGAARADGTGARGGGSGGLASFTRRAKADVLETSGWARDAHAFVGLGACGAGLPRGRRRHGR